MHYDRSAFAINSSGLTIIPIQNTSAYIGQRIQLSSIDILEIQRYYGCVPTPSSTTSTTTAGIVSTATTATTTTSATTTTATTTNESAKSAFHSSFLIYFTYVMLFIYE